VREVSTATDAAWLTGDFTGDRRAMVRATIQHPQMDLYDLTYNVYASLVFGRPAQSPQELPNVKSLKWSRGVDTDIATATMELYNTAPQPLGTVFNPVYGIDQPGYYTFTTSAEASPLYARNTREQWQSLIVPDNIVRTYEGYGFNPDTCPEDDQNLYQSGVWLIKDVEFDVAGLITLTMEDLASILRDQICFYPVIPKNFYPLSFSSVPKKSGFKQGYTVTKIVDTGGNYDPKHPPPGGWTGPTVAPTGLAVDEGNNRVHFTWTDVPNPPSGYEVAGYQIIIDNQRQAAIIEPGHQARTITGTFAPGNVYIANVAAIYLRESDGHELLSSHSDPVWVYPHTSGYGAAVTNVAINDAPPPDDPLQPAVPVPGVIGWNYSTGGDPIDGFKLILFTQGTSPLKIVYDRPVDGTGRQFFPTFVGDLSQYSVVCYPYHGTSKGAGGLYTNGWLLHPPAAGYAPHEPSPPAPGVHTVTNPTTGVTSVVNAADLNAGYSNNSNYWYVGAGEDQAVFGHTPRMALDSDASSYWLSIGNVDPGRDFAFEWFEVTIPNEEVSSVRFTTAKSGYFAYISVFAAGVWVNHDRADVIPYNPEDPISHNGGDIPYCETVACSKGEGPYEVIFRQPIPRATKVRVTLHNLQDFGLGDYLYRAGIRDISVAGLQGVNPPPVLGPVQDDDDPETFMTYETYIPPKEVPGAGEKPGAYEDYTDIVKLLCAWGGFYWPPNAQLTDSCGNVSTYDFGPGLYGLKNVDPVLGGQDGGRVWGDFMATGTAGIANLPIPQWDKKSLLDGISYVRDIIGFLFYIDELGSAVWRLPNVFSVGNYVGNLAADAGRSATIVTIDENQTLLDLKATLSSRNVRERYFIASTDGKTGALAQGYNPNPIGLRRVAGWTDQHFGSNSECLVMADMIALRALMAYRVDTVQIAGYPRIQIDDQVRLQEKVTAESYLHYVRGISSSNDLESGVWTYDLDTSWLGQDPFLNWIFNPSELSTELQAYLTVNAALGTSSFTDPTTGTSTGGTVTKDVSEVAKFVKASGTSAAVYITDGITKRHVLTQAELTALVNLGVVPSATVSPIDAAVLNAIPDAP
jgi:hypothetical protein